jgi:hypothetical protein
MGGAACAKEVLCNPPAAARAHNKARTAAVKLACERELKLAMLKGFGDLTELIERSGPLGEKQMQCYHNLAAVLDKDDKTFAAAYDELRLSLIVFA